MPELGAEARFQSPASGVVSRSPTEIRNGAELINILTDINRTHTAELREAGARRRLARNAKARSRGARAGTVQSSAPAPPGSLMPRF